MACREPGCTSRLSADTIPQVFPDNALTAAGAYSTAKGWQDLRTYSGAGTDFANAAGFRTDYLDAGKPLADITVLYRATKIDEKKYYEFVAFTDIDCNHPK